MVVEGKSRTTSVTIDAERCKGCGLCIHACPRGVLSPADCMNKAGYFPAEVKAEKAGECTGCTSCAIMCPDAAISIRRREKITSV